MPSPLILRKKFRRLGHEIAAMEKEREKTQAAAQAVCKHPLIAEKEYESETSFSYAYPPRRICEVCGLEEDGWGCGYKALLTDRPRKVSSDAFYRLRSLDFDLVGL